MVSRLTELLADLFFYLHRGTLHFVQLEALGNIFRKSNCRCNTITVKMVLKNQFIGTKTSVA
jgi:hypothetical protein